MKKNIFTLVLFFAVINAFSQVITPFAVKKQITQKGGIIYLSNVATHCNINPPAIAGASACKTGANEVAPGGTYSDNSFSAVYVDIDGNPSTFMSSSDSLNLPTCSEISWAGLFWGASRTTALTTGFETIKIKANNGAYSNVTSSATQLNTTGYNTYHCFADITAFVTAAGIKSRFTVADILTNEIGTTNKFGSWTIVVMYKNDLLTMRQLTCFNGLANIAGTSTVNIPVSGFLTPTSGPVTFETGVYVHDGDRASTGDILRFNGGSGFLSISDAVNPANDVMNSTVSNNGVITPYRKPNLNNTGGLDADIFVPNNTTKNYLGNSVTSCTFQMTTGGETYLPQMITTAIDVYEPDLRASIKVRDINGGTANPGDILEYTIKGINIGSDPSVNSFITDTIEHNANYIPNSTKIIYGANLGSKTDALSDDQVDYIAASRLLKIRIGAGANGTTGGTVINSPAGIDSTIITYSVTVTNSCTKVACDNVIDARAYILGTGAVSTNTFSNGSNPGIFDVFGCPIPGTTSTPITATACITPTAGASSPGVCAGANFTLSTVTDPDVTYLWNGPNSFTSAVQNPVLGPSTSLMSGTYTVTLSAYSGCSRTATTSVTINAAPTLTATSTSNTLCSSTTATLTASGATSYTWNPGGPGASITVTPTITTTYTVTGTNGSGCTNTRTITLTVNTTPTVNASSSSAAICNGGTATLTATGATSYTWNPGALTGSVVTVSPSGTQTYIVTGSTGSCTSTSSVVITVNAVPSLTASATPTAICAGTTSTLTATGALTYTWNPGNLVAATVTVSPSSTTNYTVTGTNAAGCTNTRTASVTFNALPTLTATASSTAICSGASSTLTASGASSYTWNPGGTGTSINVSPTTTTNYTVTGTSIEGCSNTQTITLNVTTTPTLTAAANPTAVCSGVTLTLTTSGATSYTWNPVALSGATVTTTQTTSVTYTVTGANGSCTSTRTITVALNNCPTAVNDATNTIQNTPITANAGTNDSNTGGGTFTTSQPTTGTGTITMNPTTGVYTYTPATGFTGTTSATYTLCNGSPVVCSSAVITVTVYPTLVANPDAITTTPSVTTTGTLTTNDGGVVPGTYSVTVTQTPPTTGTITINTTTGQYTFTPNPAYTGSTTTTYTVCNTAVNPQVCSNTTITIIVSGAPVAVSNTNTTIQNTPVSGNIATNDVNVNAAQNPTFTVTQPATTTGTITLNPTTGQYTFIPNPTFTGTTSTTYTVCNLSGLCSNTTLTFTVFPTLVANPDVITTTPNTTATGTLTANDGGVVPGGSYSVTVTQTPPTTGTITINPTTGQYTFTPNPGYTGSTTTTYTICNTAVTPQVCSNTTITITVGNVPVAIADGTTTIINTPVSGNAGTNDTGSGPANNPVFTASPVTAGTGTLVMDPTTGVYTYTPQTGFTGTTSATYTLCNLSSPPCSTTTITFTVYPAIVANPDVITTTPSVTTTGTLTTNDGGIVPGTYSVTVTQTPPTTGTITVDPATGSYTFTPNPAYTGSATTTYTVCNTAVNPQVCSSTTITITVGNMPVAVADGTTTSIDTPVNGTAGTNDTGSTPANNPVFTASPVTAGTGTLVMDPTTGSYTYTPQTGFTGTASATYTLCNLSSPPCSTTTITFTVYPAIVANPDVINTTPGTTVNGTLTTNDNGIMPGGTYSVSVTQTPPTTGTITVDPATGQYTFTPNPTYTGSTTTTYTICNTSVNPIVCSNTTITINAFPNPSPVDDFTTTIVDTPVSGNAGANDGGTTGGTFTTGQPTVGTGTITMDPTTGQYTFTPSTGYTGTTSATYTLCNGAPVTCSTAVITVTVFPTLAANPDVITTTPSVTVTGTLTTNDGGVVPEGTYSITVTQTPPTTGTITIDPATGQYTFTPNPTYTGSTTTTYTICNTAVTPQVCSNTTITILVGNVPVAVADATTTIENTPVNGDASTNDTGAIPSLNPVFTAGPVTAGTGTLTMDPATGQYTYTPSAGFTGTTVATYTLCNLSSPPCSTTTITFTVFPTLVANPDVIATTPSVTITGTLTTNDGGVVPEGTYSVTVTQTPPTTGTITIDPATGQYTFTPNPTYTGSTTTTYTICNTSVNPVVCSNTTITIIVGNQPIAVADSTTTMENIPVSGDASTNDGGVSAGNNPVFTAGPVTAGTGTLTMDPSTGQYTYTPATGFTGTTSATYTLCNLSSPPCSTTTITFTVFPALVANPDVIVTTPSVTVTGTLTTNDGGVVPEGTYSVSVTQTPPSTGTITVDPATGQYTFTPTPGYTGTTTTTYTICNTVVNPVVCSNTTITIIVGAPQVAVSKTVLSTIKTGPVTYQSVFAFNVTNIGNTVGNNVQLVDNLNNTFPAPMTYTVVGLNSNAPLTTNIAYNGNTNIAMLSGTNSLNPLQSSVVTLTVDFSPNSTTLTALSNTGIGSTSGTPDPTGTNPHTSTDTTSAGTNPDPDGDGNPNEPGENEPTVFGQQIAAAKTGSSFTMVNATTFQTVFTFNIANVGPVVATNIQLTDNLNNTFPAPMTYTVVGLNANSPLTANGNYNGSTDIALLSGVNSMVSGANSVVTLTVNFSANSTTLSSMSNIGIASTSGSPDPTGTNPHLSTDTTDAGTNPDPDGDGVPNEPGENDPTVFGQQIGGSKTSSGFTKLNPTTFQTVFTFNVANYGPLPATNVQLTDNLNNTFPAPMTYTVVGLNANAPLTANAGYNGNTNIAMLGGSDVLNIAQSSIVTLTVNFSPNSTTTSSLTNIGIVSTSDTPDPTGNNTHISVDTTGAGTNPDPDGDGNPNEPGENNPTFFGEQIGAAKTASALTKINATTYQTVFTFNVANVGPVAANNIQLTDNLNNAFPAPMTYTVAGITAGAPLTANAGYNGNTDIALLSGSNSMNPAQSAVVTLTVNFSPNTTGVTSLTNIGIVSTSGTPDPTGNNTHTSLDTTATGTVVDPDGDGNPNEPGENNPTYFGQQIGVAKAALPSVFIGNGVSQTTFVFTVQNMGVLPATNVQLTDNLNSTFPAPITYTVMSLTSGSNLAANGSYDGNSVVNMLSGNNTLAVGASETVTLVVNYNMNSSTLTSLANSGVVTVSGPDGVLSSDTTNTGTTVDPDEDGNPNEPGENDPTIFIPATDTTTVKDSVLFIPEGFSPNGDGVNDIYIIRGIEAYPNNTVTILNRWGNVVFKVGGYDNVDKVWNGKSSEGLRYGGDELPEGTYFYILDPGNGDKPYKGYIYLNKTVK